jgi:hypothetical protein
MDFKGEDAGKILFGLAILVLLVTTFVAFGALFMVAFTGNLNTASAEATTTTLFNGVPATPYQLNAPIISLSWFGKAGAVSAYSQYNDTKLAGAKGAITITIDPKAAHGGNAWNNVTVVFTLQGVNATWNSGPTQTYTDIDSTCLTPGGVLTFNFVNATTQDPSNVTNVTITYNRYVTNSAYTKNDAAGTITPTLGGNYQVTYTYGTGGIDYTNAKDTLSQGVTTITQIPSWLTIIVLVFVLLVIFVILGAIVLVARGMMGGGQQ